MPLLLFLCLLVTIALLSIIYHRSVTRKIVAEMASANGPKTGFLSELDDAIDTIVQTNLRHVDGQTVVNTVDVQFSVEAIVKGRLSPLVRRRRTDAGADGHGSAETDHAEARGRGPENGRCLVGGELGEVYGRVTSRNCGGKGPDLQVFYFFWPVCMCVPMAMGKGVIFGVGEQK